jgi:uncharacterized protein (DUF1800 family)
MPHAQTQALGKLTEAEKIAHLLNRAAFGPWYGDVQRIRQIGFDKYIDEQLQPELINDVAADTQVAGLKAVTMDPSALRAGYQNKPRAVVQQLQAHKLIRAVYSLRQLREVMVDFWFNHFNLFSGKDALQFLTPGYERDAIRPHVLDKFKDLLLATARHPGMLVYLDNALSSASGINENYAREVMELHTLGVDGGYTQRDVQEVARCFTGWTVDKVEQPSAFVFREDMHDAGEKTVLGHAIPASGYNEGETVLDILVHHPSTAKFIATKLVRRFVADDPPASLINRAAEVFTRTDGDISAMLRTILTSDEFFSPDAFRAKVKSPFELIASSLRAMNAGVDMTVSTTPYRIIMRPVVGQVSPPGQGKAPAEMFRATFDAVFADFQLTQAAAAAGLSLGAARLLDWIERMRHFLYAYEEPTGYPDRGAYWLSGWSVLHRMRWAAALAGNEIDGVSVDLENIAKQFNASPPSDVAWRSALALLTGVPEGRSAENPVTSRPFTESFALALGSPEFQHK